MKILIINTVNTGRNGITNVIFNLLKFSSNKNVQFDYISINNNRDGYQDLIESQNGHFFIIKRREVGVYQYLTELIKTIKTEQYDIVHIHGNSHTLFLELLASKIGGAKRTIIHSHASDSKFRNLHRFLSIPFFSLLDLKIACSDKAGKWMFGKREFLLLKNGINTKKYKYSEDDRKRKREQLGISDQTKVLCHVGMFDDNKNQTFIIKIIEVLNEENVSLILVGDGIRKETVELLTKEVNVVNKVYFAGNVDDVNMYLSAADIFLLPSHYEGFPMSLIEAQASGLYCIVSDTVTRSVDITGNVSFMNISESPLDWGKAIMNIQVGNRGSRSDSACEQIISKGYDIQQISNNLLDMYCYAIREDSNK